MNWDKEFFGQIVTPESWVGGIIEYIGPFSGKGDWETLGHLPSEEQWNKNLYDQEVAKIRRNYKPIFPPFNWADKYDFEIMDELWPKVGLHNCWEKTIFHDEFYTIVVTPKGDIKLGAGYLEHGNSDYCDCSIEPEQIEDIDLFIMRMQNAKRFADRLKKYADKR